MLNIILWVIFFIVLISCMFVDTKTMITLSILAIIIEWYLLISRDKDKDKI